jgi:hypothetical protein
MSIPGPAARLRGGRGLYVRDVGAAFQRAIAAGAKATMPPADMVLG